MEHIERMKVELQELEEKIEKLEIFLEKEEQEPKFTDEIQRILLVNQKECMKSYARILKHRINYDTLKVQKETDDNPCFDGGVDGGSYDQALKGCTLNKK